MPKAEETLRRAYASARADARVRQNLGLVVGLQGRFGEAESIVKADLPAEEAAANVAYLKQMLARKDNPRAGGGGAGGGAQPAELTFSHPARIVVLRESGGPSIPETLEINREAAAYWVVRSSRTMTVVRGF